MDAAIHLSRRAYGYLLLLYPLDFRRDFAGQMTSTFEDELRDAYRLRRARGLADVWLWAFREVLTVALPLQLRNGLVVASAGSLVGTSALYLALAWALTDKSHLHRAVYHWRH